MKTPDLLLTYNVKYGEKLPQIFDWLANLSKKPDIACFQEFPDPFKDGIACKLEQLGYSFRFGSAIEKKGGVFGQLTAAWLGKKISRSQVIDFGLSPVERYGFGVDGRRSALITEISDGDRSIQVANDHWPLVASYAQRLLRTAQVIDAIHPDEPAVLLGDFNNIHIRREIGRKRLVKDLERFGFVDSGLTEPTFPHPIAHQLDFVFARGRDLKNPEIRQVGLSDHEPLFVEVH